MRNEWRLRLAGRQVCTVFSLRSHYLPERGGIGSYDGPFLFKIRIASSKGQLKPDSTPDTLRILPRSTTVSAPFNAIPPDP